MVPCNKECKLKDTAGGNLGLTLFTGAGYQTAKVEEPEYVKDYSVVADTVTNIINVNLKKLIKILKD